MAQKRNDPTRDFLDGVKWARAEVARRKRMADELEWRATKTTAQLSALPRGGGSDSQALLAALADARGAELAAMVEAERVKAEVSAFIDRLPKRIHREVLAYRYLECAGWRTVQKRLQAAGVYYSDRQITRYHGAALAEARRLYEGVMPNEVHP